MYQLIRPLLFQFDPEKIHYSIFNLIKSTSKIPGVAGIYRSAYEVKDSKLETEVLGLKFKNPVGLAAGFDKNGVLFNELANFGFGFVEVGTVTPNAQEGNPKKRLFRLKADNALINRMGFNNWGVDAIAENLKHRPSDIIIGGNIGKNNQTLAEEAQEEYEYVFKTLHPLVDYFVVNVSCPNVGNSSKMQDKYFLIDLLKDLDKINQQHPKPKPILIKIGPNRSEQQLEEVIEIVDQTKIAGVVATNTTTDRSGLITSGVELTKIGNGGLSGKPLENRSNEVIRFLAEKSNKAFPIIGVGGIHSVDDALRKLDAGADLLQVYTGFVYEGPVLVKRINKAIAQRRNG